LVASFGPHPVITIIVLFIVFFTVFFLLIYGSLRLVERRKSNEDEEDEVEEEDVGTASTKGIPTYAKFKTCQKCGTTMPGVASFCPECGAPQIAA
jgi:heme/copper-type cytochrome/quinol oxidase subunit 2